MRLATTASVTSASSPVSRVLFLKTGTLITLICFGRAPPRPARLYPQPSSAKTARPTTSTMIMCLFTDASRSFHRIKRSNDDQIWPRRRFIVKNVAPDDDTLSVWHPRCVGALLAVPLMGSGRIGKGRGKHRPYGTTISAHSWFHSKGRHGGLPLHQPPTANGRK